MSGVSYGKEEASRDFVIHARSDGITRITVIHRAYDSLLFVILFPSCDDGLQLNISYGQGKGHVTAMKFYSYRLNVRSSEGPLHLNGRLVHHYAVYIYV